MFRRLFIDHPRSVDENYVQHFAVASKFGVTMIWGGLCALVHAVVPGWCVTTGSRTIERLRLLKRLIDAGERCIQNASRDQDKR